MDNCLDCQKEVLVKSSFRMTPNRGVMMHIDGKQEGPYCIPCFERITLSAPKGPFDYMEGPDR